jgi:hypothetical protein
MSDEPKKHTRAWIGWTAALVLLLLAIPLSMQHLPRLNDGDTLWFVLKLAIWWVVRLAICVVAVWLVIRAVRFVWWLYWVRLRVREPQSNNGKRQ